MQRYEDPNDAGNAASHQTGKLCVNRCGRPAGTQWSPLLCQPCNVVRMNRINDSMRLIEENLTRMVEGPDRKKVD